ncbi:MAG TPA: hypothetical protein VKY89_23595 [Thermoanaerobaculia bacterium]|nr:hypothetical protein [Thermoanaerobaculia bacterium]
MKTATSTLATALLLGALALPLAAQDPAGVANAGATAGAAVTAAVPDASTAYSLLWHPRALAKFLRLSASQTTTLLSLADARDKANQPLRQARGPLCQQLETDLDAATPDPAAIGADTLNLYDNREAIAANRKTFDTSFSAILDPTQLAAYDALKQLAFGLDRYADLIGGCPKS